MVAAHCSVKKKKKNRERERERERNDECGMLNNYNRYMKLNLLLTYSTNIRTNTNLYMQATRIIYIGSDECGM